MLGNHGHWVESWHELRSTMRPQDTDSEILTQKEESEQCCHSYTSIHYNNVYCNIFISLCILTVSERDDVITPDIIETESNYSDNSTQV